MTDNDIKPMSAGEYTILLHLTGYNHDDVAKRFDVSVKSARYWGMVEQNRTIPDEVATWLRKQFKALMSVSDNALLAAKTLDMPLNLYATDKDTRKQTGVNQRMHRAIVSMAWLKGYLEGIEVAIDTMPAGITDK